MGFLYDVRKEKQPGRGVTNCIVIRHGSVNLTSLAMWTTLAFRGNNIALGSKWWLRWKAPLSSLIYGLIVSENGPFILSSAWEDGFTLPGIGNGKTMFSSQRQFRFTRSEQTESYERESYCRFTEYLSEALSGPAWYTANRWWFWHCSIAHTTSTRPLQTTGILFWQRQALLTNMHRPSVQGWYGWYTRLQSSAIRYSGAKTGCWSMYCMHKRLQLRYLCLWRLWAGR